MKKEKQTALIVLSVVGLGVVIWLFLSRKGQSIIQQVAGDGAGLELPGAIPLNYVGGDNRLFYTPADMADGEGWALPAYDRPLPDYTVITLPDSNSPNNNANPSADCGKCKVSAAEALVYSGATPPSANTYLPFAWGR